MALASPLAGAESLYVIDRLQIGLHAEHRANSAILGLLPTGTKLDVLQRGDEFIQVRDPNGKQGWVDARFVKAQLDANSQDNEFKKRIKITQAELQEARIRIADQKLQLGKAQRALKAARAAAKNTEASVAAAPVPAPAPESGSPAPTWTPTDITRWQIGFLIALFVLGLFGGAWLVDWLNRRRHGGFRI